MGCRRYQRLIALNRSGELLETEAQALAAHICTCTACAREAASMGEVRGVLAAVREIPWTPGDPDVLTGKILDRITTDRVPNPSSSVAVFIDRLLDFATLPVVRVASACFLLVAVGSFLWQSMTVIGEVRQLEVQQAHGYGSRPVPQVGYAVDVRTVEAFHGTALLQHTGVRSGKGSVILSGRALAFIQETGMMVPALHSVRSRMGKDVQAAREKSMEIRSGIRPVLCYGIAEGV
jgi:hypothetical protein